MRRGRSLHHHKCSRGDFCSSVLQCCITPGCMGTGCWQTHSYHSTEDHPLECQSPRSAATTPQQQTACTAILAKIRKQLGSLPAPQLSLKQTLTVV